MKVIDRWLKDNPEIKLICISTVTGGTFAYEA